MQSGVRYKKLCIALIAVLASSFAVLGGVGYRALHQVPPIPEAVTTEDGTLMVSGEMIREGQSVWQSMGGQEVGSIFGHGSYVAPDWTADWLHREATFILSEWAHESGSASFESMQASVQIPLKFRLQNLIRNKYI